MRCTIIFKRGFICFFEMQYFFLKLIQMLIIGRVLADDSGSDAATYLQLETAQGLILFLVLAICFVCYVCPHWCDD